MTKFFKLIMNAVGLIYGPRPAVWYVIFVFAIVATRAVFLFLSVTEPGPGVVGHAASLLLSVVLGVTISLLAAELAHELLARLAGFIFIINVEAFRFCLLAPTGQAFVVMFYLALLLFIRAYKHSRLAEMAFSAVVLGGAGAAAGFAVSLPLAFLPWLLIYRRVSRGTLAAFVLVFLGTFLMINLVAWFWLVPEVSRPGVGFPAGLVDAALSWSGPPPAWSIVGYGLLLAAFLGIFFLCRQSLFGPLYLLVAVYFFINGLVAGETSAWITSLVPVVSLLAGYGLLEAAGSLNWRIGRGMKEA